MSLWKEDARNGLPSFVLDESRNQFWSPEAREAGDPGVLTREPVHPETSDMKAAPAMGFCGVPVWVERDFPTQQARWVCVQLGTEDT